MTVINLNLIWQEAINEGSKIEFVITNDKRNYLLITRKD